MLRARVVLLVAAIGLCAGMLVRGVAWQQPPAISPPTGSAASDAGNRGRPRVPSRHRERPATPEVIYVALATDTDTYLVPIADRTAARSPQDALTRLITFRSEREGIASPIPPGTRLRSVRIDEDGTAVADFSREIQDNFNGGARFEQVMVYSIVNTLAQFPQVKRVRILVEGQPVESLGGHIDASVPLEPDRSMVLTSGWGGRE